MNYDAAVRTESAVQGTGLPAENFTTSPSGELTPATQVVPDNQTTSFGTSQNDYTFKNPMEESLKSKYGIKDKEQLKEEIKMVILDLNQMVQLLIKLIQVNHFLYLKKIILQKMQKILRNLQLLQMSKKQQQRKN